MRSWKPFVVASICAAVVAATLAINFAGADTAPSSLVAVTPCRLLDTRLPGIGDHPGPLGPGEIATIPVTGAHGACNIPVGSSAIVANVTIQFPSASSWLTIYPADVAQPNSSNLNWTAFQSPTPNQVTVATSATG